MKFIKNLLTNKFVFLTILGLLAIISVECLKEKKTEKESSLKSFSEISSEIQRKHKRSRRSRTPSHRQLSELLPTNPPIQNNTNYTISKMFNKNINSSTEGLNLNTFKIQNKNMKFHQLFDKQLEEIFNIFKKNKFAGVTDFRSAYSLFISHFENCDKNKDHLLDLPEFDNCLKNDPYLSLIQIPDKLYASYLNYTLKTVQGFSNLLFTFVDCYDRGSANFYDYLMLRLFAFSWRKCSVNAPFIDETSFECAVDIFSSGRSINTNSLRKLFELSLELSNSDSLRTLDFISYYAIGSSIRLFGKINAKEDYEAGRNEFDIALDTNVLPTRFNQKVIDDLFKLVSSPQSGKSGINLYSFVFYDHFLKLFYQGSQGDRRWFVSPKELSLIVNYYLFPKEILHYIKLVPLTNYTETEYNLRAHLHNNLLTEDDYLNKFLEIKSTVYTSRTNVTSVNIEKCINRIFTLLDTDDDHFINFYEFGLFIQTFFIYTKVDERHSDKALVGSILTEFTEHFTKPMVSQTFRDRARRFSMIEQDLYIDPFYTLAVMRMDDLVNYFARKSDPTTIKEIELRLLLEKFSLNKFPDVYINKCFRGKDEDGVPKYDWECSIIKAITRTIKYEEHKTDLEDIKTHGFNLNYTQIDYAGY